MKNIIYAMILFATIQSCKYKIAVENNKEEPTVTANKIESNKIESSIIDSTKINTHLLGSFVGAFGDNKMMLLISKLGADSVSGRSVVGGNNRPFIGTINLKDGKYNIVAKEPGDDKNDGIFKFAIDTINTNMITGTWTPLQGQNKQGKGYVLQRKAFVYNPKVGTYKASQKLLTTSDVENLVRDELDMMRNEIFARHGYCFKKKELRAYFENENWYVPNTTDVRNELTDIERKNIALIKRYEKYNEDYGDDFGR